MDLDMSLRQSQTLSPQMMQSMEILQMGSQELLEYIENLVQENPVLDAEVPLAQPDATDELRKKMEWLESTDVQNRYYHQQDVDADGENDPISNYGNMDDEDQNLYFYVRSQLRALTLPPQVMQAAEYIIESLNSNGWLDEDIPALCRRLGMDGGVVGAALEAVQALEPAGVAARNLAECLALQLHRRRGDYSLPLRIVAQYLDPLSKNRYNYISCAMNIPVEQVREACDLIRSLNPRPATGFSARENLTYISPDIFVVNFPDHFELLTNDYFFPSLRLSGYYCDLLKVSDDTQVKEYLNGKVRQAKWVVSSIEQRRSTLLNCAQRIVERQEPFFRDRGHLVPMALCDIAGLLGVHESTVSRAIKSKYLQCTSGVFPLSYFFSRGLGEAGDGASPDKAKSLLRDLIAGENPKKPLSDQKLSLLMGEKGVELSRRTVAKYRDEMGIAATTGRKQYE